MDRLHQSILFQQGLIIRESDQNMQICMIKAEQNM